jgi:hypothetical protein
MENGLDFAQWAESPKENFPIAQVPTWIAALLKMENAGESYAALLSPQTFAKNRNHHPDVAITDYLRIDEMLNRAEVVFMDSTKTVVVIEEAGVSWLVALKATQTGKALFVTSFRKTHAGDIARKKRNAVLHKK